MNEIEKYYNKFIPHPNIGFFHGNFDTILPDIEYNRIRYLSAILKNKLGDYKPKVKETEKVKVFEEAHTPDWDEAFERFCKVIKK